jgi:alpha-1,6-mannosyltransferase
MAITIGLFFRSPEFFAYFNETQTWYFYTPRDAFRGLIGLLDISIPYHGKVLRLFFILIGGYYIVQYWRKPTWKSMRLAVLAVMTAMLFGVASHIWPWYLLWVLGPAALVPGSALARWATGVALVMPLPILIWIVYPEIGNFYIFDLPAILLYSFAVLWFIFVPRRWFPYTSSADALPPSILPAMAKS